MKFLIAAVLLLNSASAAAIELTFGPFTIMVSDSWTAQVFHMVDMLSQWDDSSHRAYARWARDNRVLDEEDRRLLEEHAEMRRRRGWGNGFEQAFLSEEAIEVATVSAIGEGLLSREEAEAERAILLHFSPKLEPLREQQRSEMELFLAQIQSETQRLAPWFARLVRFTRTGNPVIVPVFVVANSELTSGGGEANGGRIVVEVPAPSPRSTLFHESLHVLLRPHAAALEAAAESMGLSPNNLNEGITYALAPGLTDDSAQTDSIAEGLARYVLRGTPATDDYVQSYMIANVLRPLLRSSIDNGETIDEFLPKAVEKWLRFAPR